MIATVVEVGDNLNVVLLALIVALPTLVGLIAGKQAKDAANQATAAAHSNAGAVAQIAAELQPNTGSTAFDKITNGQRETQAMVVELARSVADLGARVAMLEPQPITTNTKDTTP